MKKLTLLLIPILLLGIVFAANGKGPWYTDGLGPVAEQAWGTNLNEWDTDNDGYGDGFEVAIGWDPTAPDGGYGGADDDADILSNAAETYRYGTSPSLWDTDNDGIGDSVEIARGMNPNSADYEYGGQDTDEDKLSDVFEIDVIGTDPEHSDSDGDDYTDSCEYAAGTDPNDAGDFPAPPEGPPQGAAIGIAAEASMNSFLLVMVLLLQLIVIYMLYTKK